MEFVCELLAIRDPKMLSRGLRPFDRRKLETALKGVNVEVTHRKSSRQVNTDEMYASVFFVLCFATPLVAVAVAAR